MANYYASWRTNYFKIKDEPKFREWATTIPETIVEVKDGIAWLGQALGGDATGIPCARRTEDDNYVEMNFCAELAEHLTDDTVAIIMEVGAEKLRYLIGYAVAVRASGEELQVSIGDIYKDVAECWDDIPQDNVTMCEY